MRNRKAGLGVVLVLVMVALVWLAPAASAACHRFGLQVSPTSVSEGDTVTVTVDRDGSVADSSVRVTATGQSAQAGVNFSELDEQVSFTGSELEKSVTIDILAGGETDMTFTVGLSGPDGCEVNPNFSLADEATVTIAAGEVPAPVDDEDPTTSEQDPVVSEDPQEESAGEEDADDDEGLPVGLIIAAVVVLVAAGGFLAFRKRSSV
ncbi:MAG: hypothetical protein WD602_06540 [Actinomycetota bacterium]